MSYLSKITAIALLSVGLFNSCKNDLKIIAPYKEIPQVHAILTPQDSMQMIRINKVFLGEGNAAEMAKVPDSVNYKAGELTVWLERFWYGDKVGANVGDTKMELYFRDTLIQINEGAFSTTQRVYVLNDRLHESGTYKLFIKNNHTGNVFTASANSIEPPPLTGLPPFAAPFYPYTPQPGDPDYFFTDFSNFNTTYSIRSKASNGGYLHDLTIRLFYYDSIAPTTQIPTGRIDKSYDYAFFPKQLYEQQDIGATKYFLFTFKSLNLFAEFASELKKRGNPSGFRGRKVFRVDFISYAVPQEYYDYLQFSAPSLSFAQEKPLYSNFDNKAALGIFTFRSRRSVAKVPALVFVDEFANNVYTCTYNFRKNDNTFGSCP